jgi:hypothetical protein
MEENLSALVTDQRKFILKERVMARMAMPGGLADPQIQARSLRRSSHRTRQECEFCIQWWCGFLRFLKLVMKAREIYQGFKCALGPFGSVD